MTGPVISPDDPDYDPLRMPWNWEAMGNPGAIALVSSVQDVQAVVLFAQEKGYPLCVSAGKHSRYSSINDSLVLDLRNLNHVDVDPISKKAVVQGGCLIQHMLSELSKHNLVIPTGSDPSTGIAGLCLSGGIGLLSRLFGLTCDSLIGVTIVLADGSVVKANSIEHQELFWAVRGGGGNFGVVVEFEFLLYSLEGGVDVAKQVYKHQSSLNPLNSSLRSSLLSHRDYWEKMPNVVTMTCILRPAELEVTYYHFGHVANALECLEQVRKSVSKPNQHIQNIERYFDQMTLHPTGHYYEKSLLVYDLPDSAIMALMKAIYSAPHSGCRIHIQPLGGKLADINTLATPFVHRKAKYWILIINHWDGDDPMRQSCHEWTNKLLAQLENWKSGSYQTVGLNGMEETLGKSFSTATISYYGRNLMRLVQIKCKYDHNNVFKFNQNIPPLRLR
jgi:hypothetical protein